MLTLSGQNYIVYWDVCVCMREVFLMQKESRNKYCYLKTELIT